MIFKNHGGDSFEYDENVPFPSVTISNTSGTVTISRVALTAFLVSEFVRPRLLERVKSLTEEEILMALISRPK